MHSHRLILDGGPSHAEWLLQWGNVAFILRDPDGRLVFEAEAAYAHRAVELFELYSEGKVSFATPHGSLTFKKNRAAVADLRALVEAGLGADAEYRSELRSKSLRVVWLGLALFLAAGGLLGVYGWYASTAPDPPPGHWIESYGRLIHGVLLVSAGVALGGPLMCWFGARQWLRVRRIERAVVARKAQGHAEPGTPADGGGDPGF